MNLSLFFNWAPPGWFLYFFFELHGRTTTQTTLWCAWWCAKHRRANICRTQASATPNEMHYANVKRDVAEVTSFLQRLRRCQKLQMPRVRARKLSRFKKQLHGCVGADCLYVFGPENKEVHCPKCGESRYSPDGKPKEVSRSLFRSPIYKPLPYYYHITYMYIAPMYVYNIHIIYVALTIN